MRFQVARQEFVGSCYTENMMLYDLSETARLLRVAPSTLRRWRAKVGHVGSRGVADRRRVWITRPELITLALVHKRFLLIISPSGDNSSQNTAYRIIEPRQVLAALEKRETST